MAAPRYLTCVFVTFGVLERLNDTGCTGFTISSRPLAALLLFSSAVMRAPTCPRCGGAKLVTLNHTETTYSRVVSQFKVVPNRMCVLVHACTS